MKHAERYATEMLKNQLSSDLTFHNFEHTEKVVEAVQEIGTHEKLSNEEMEMVQIAAWFHDTGYRDAYEGHEEKSKAIALAFLLKEEVLAEKIDKILGSILVTQEESLPKNKIEKVLVDAVQATAKGGDYKLLNQELLAVKKVEQTEVESLQKFLKVVLKYEFHTAYGKEVLVPSREKLTIKLEKRLKKLKKEIDESLSSDLGITAEQLKTMKKKLQKAEGRPERGIETMFRLTSKNHLDLSGMADSKANIMISINSIIMSVVLGSQMQRLDWDSHLIYPTLFLLAVNLSSLVFAILSLRPNVSKGLFTREDIENHNTNLLFFGNFHKMKREDYHWGMNHLMENANFLYSNLIDDIYFLGVVLARKYKLLRTSYNIFMFGMVAVVIAYVISLGFSEGPILDTFRN